MAAEVRRRDGFELQLRVGLGSGRVIAGEIGSGSLGYAATGETVPGGTRSLACAVDPYLGIVAGEPDIVTDASKATLDDALEHKAGAC